MLRATSSLEVTSSLLVSGVCEVWGCGSIRFGGTSIMVCDAYGDTISNVALVAAGSGVSDLGEDDDGWNLGVMPLSRNDEVCMSLRVEFTAIKTEWCELNLIFLDEAGV